VNELETTTLPPIEPTCLSRGRQSNPSSSSKRTYLREVQNFIRPVVDNVRQCAFDRKPANITTATSDTANGWVRMCRVDFWGSNSPACSSCCRRMVAFAPRCFSLSRL